MGEHGKWVLTACTSLLMERNNARQMGVHFNIFRLPIL